MENEKQSDAEGRLQAYYEQPYLTELDSTVTAIEPKGSQYIVQLDRTIFYPEGGGQPTDQGEIVGPEGKLKVEQVRTGQEGQIRHQGKLTGMLSPGDKVKQTIKWQARHKNMRVHSAGHLIHDVLMTMITGLTPTKGNHGQKAFLEYSGNIEPNIREALESAVNEAVAQDLPIITRDASYAEIEEKCQFIPPGLPRNKQLRIIQIGTFAPMPDGGVQVKATSEIGHVVIHNIAPADGVTVIRYGVGN